ncbi:glycosyl hydrolase family 18 protein [Candidatus Protochlamydia phocaeensis]|uniref:glycosyl hydrolase family 18 protein n=1 Tax=Candidatus Protochlamydia phocaeensis TaxID=1414722 RepID=UPI000838C4CA|nr:glycosyl hydrolase family 18 protein [Candidatus Protochlamydia phocaeensis]
MSSISPLSGRSPEADQIYQQYLAYYADINTKIHTIDQMPQTADTQEARSKLLDLQQQLYPLYTKEYNSSSASLASFIGDAASIESQVLEIYNSVTSQTTSPPVTSPPTDSSSSPISVYTATQRSPDADQIYQQYLSYYNDINTKIRDIDALPYEQRTLASVQQDRAQLQALQQQLAPIYKNQYNSSSATLASFVSAVASIEEQVTQVYNAAMNATVPTSPPVTPPDTPPVTPVTPVTPVDVAPAPSAMSIQNGVWYLDWTSYNYPIPQGVNAVDVFVGNMSLDSSGKPVIGGFGTLSQNPATFAAFIQGCKAQGITVNISIGGSGGSYDNTWDVLTSNNVQSFAQALANFCTSNGISGVDFDCEKFTSATDHPDQQALVGTLIKEFKMINPNFQTSLDTNAGFGPNFPWQGIVQNIMNAAIYSNPTTNQPTSGVDRVNIMAYFNSLSDEQGWVTGWADWLKSNYNLDPAQITVGMDPASGAYDTTAFAAWAAQKGYSTFLWNYDPNQQAASDAIAKNVLAAYQSEAVT